MKQVMLLGDSLRMGYEPLVRELLKGKAEVSGPNENGRWAGYTLNSFRFRIPGMPKPDVSIGITDFGIWEMIISWEDRFLFRKNMSHVLREWLP